MDQDIALFPSGLFYELVRLVKEPGDALFRVVGDVDAFTVDVAGRFHALVLVHAARRLLAGQEAWRAQAPFDGGRVERVVAGDRRRGLDSDLEVPGRVPGWQQVVVVGSGAGRRPGCDVGHVRVGLDDGRAGRAGGRQVAGGDERQEPEAEYVAYVESVKGFAVRLGLVADEQVR